MGKILFVLDVPEPEPRKVIAPPVQKHKSKKNYSRKAKHKGKVGEPLIIQGLFLCHRCK